MKKPYIKFYDKATNDQKKQVIACSHIADDLVMNGTDMIIAIRKYINTHEAKLAYAFKQEYGYWPFFFDVKEALFLDGQMKEYLEMQAVVYRDSIKSGDTVSRDLAKCQIMAIHQFITLKRHTNEEA